MSDEKRAVQIGDRIRDNDPRTNNLVLTVTTFAHKHRWVNGAFVEAPCAVASFRGDGTYETRISLDRIHTDGKPRKSGWSLVMP